MLETYNPLHAALLMFVVAVAIIDWRTHRIPNLLCTVAALFGLVLQAWLHGEAGLLTALGGAVVGLAIFLPFYVLRAFGAGDVKAMATVGIFLGVKATVVAVGATLIAGGVVGLMVMLFQSASAPATLHRLIALFAAPVASMRASMQEPPQNAQRFPYGVAIACGTAATLLMMTH